MLCWLVYLTCMTCSDLSMLLYLTHFLILNTGCSIVCVHLPGVLWVLLLRYHARGLVKSCFSFGDTCMDCWSDNHSSCGFWGSRYHTLVAAPFPLPAFSVQGSSCWHSQQLFLFVLLIAILVGVRVTSCFDLHFLEDECCWVVFVCRSFVYIFGETSLQVICPF